MCSLHTCVTSLHNNIWLIVCLPRRNYLGVHTRCRTSHFACAYRPICDIRNHDDRFSRTRNRTGEFRKFPRPIRNALLLKLCIVQGTIHCRIVREPLEGVYLIIIIITDINPACCSLLCAVFLCPFSGVRAFHT